MTPASRKNIERRPRIAKMLDVKTMKGSLVTAKIAGIESTAKIRSLISTQTSARKSGVARSWPFVRTKNAPPW